MNPLVSICVPVYNSGQYIEKCARSLFCQTYENIQYIFVDDCSKDDSVQKLTSIVESLDEPRRKMVHIERHHHNRGVAASRKTSLSLVEGEFILWVDSDDYIDSNYVYKLIDVQRHTDADIVSCSFVFHSSEGDKILTVKDITDPKEMVKQMLSYRIPVSLWSRLYRSSLFSRDICFEEGRDNGEDYRIVPILVFLSKKIAIQPDTMYHYVQHEFSMTHTYDKKISDDVWLAYNYLVDYFSKTDFSLVKYVNVGYVRVLMKDLIKCCRFKDKDAYYVTRHRIQLMPIKSFMFISIPNFPFLLIRNYSLSKMLVYIGDRIKSISCRCLHN